MRHWWNYIVDTIEQPREELSRRQHQLRSGWDLVVHCGEQLHRQRAEGMAAELTYRTIFSLIPVVVLGLVMFRVFGGLDDVQLRVENQLYSFFGVPEIPEQYMPGFEDDDASVKPTDTVMRGLPADRRSDYQTASALLAPQIGGQPPADFTPTQDGAGRDETASDSIDSIGQVETDVQARAIIRQTLHEVTSKIASLDFASIGVFGLILFIYAAVALADSTEHLFNRIFDAPTQRPIHIRVAVHWSIITLGSGLLAMSLYMSGQFVDWFGTIVAGTWTITLLQHALSLLAAWVLLFLLYALMPNTHVSVRAAVVGSAVGAVLWQLAKYGFQVYVTTAVPYLELYGSLGVIPLFLLWIYVTWLIVLFGLILTYTLQTVRGKNFRRREDSRESLPSGDPDWMLPIISEVALSFAGGEAVGRQELADRLGLSSRVVHEMETHLIESNLLRRVSGGNATEDQLTLARPAEQIPVAEVMRLAHRFRPTNDHPAWEMLATLKESECQAAGSQTLADLLATEPTK